MTKPTDDLEAVRAVVEALQGFDAGDQERIIRWAREKLGPVESPAPPAPAPVKQMPSPVALDRPAPPVIPPAPVGYLPVDQVAPTEEQYEAVDMLMPAPEQKNRAFLIIGIIVMAVAVGFLILMIMSHGK